VENVSNADKPSNYMISFSENEPRYKKARIVVAAAAPHRISLRKANQAPFPANSPFYLPGLMWNS
jgi:hypothetical protein